MPCCTERRLTKFHLVTATLGLVAGLIAFFMFTFYYHNYHGGVWGLISFFVACVNFHTHLLLLHSRLFTTHTKKSLLAMVMVGAAVALASLIAMVCYIVLSIVHKIPMMPVGPSLAMGASQAFLAFKYSLTMSYTSFKYSKSNDLYTVWPN